MTEPAEITLAKTRRNEKDYCVVNIRKYWEKPERVSLGRASELLQMDENDVLWALENYGRCDANECVVITG